MSRSFPCPPSGYARNWANGQNLVELTKMERLVVCPKKALPKEKKEKEKRKDKKGRHEKSRKSLERFVKLDDKQEQKYSPSKKNQDDSEQHEKSGLTEEHEQPQNLCYLSDGSQSNKKRKREDPPAVESHVKAVPGKPLRIRFVFRKPEEPKSVPQEERFCSTSSVQRLTQDKNEAQETHPSGVTRAESSEQEENLLSTSRGDAALPIDMKKKKRKQSKESRYNALFEDWLPPALSSAVLDVDDDEQDWLFSSRRKEKPRAEEVEKNENTSTNLPSLGDPSWPKAQFLPEVGIYSLPYTVLF